MSVKTSSFQLVPGWEALPAGYTHRDVAGVAVDSSDNVYLITRGDARVLIYDRAGTFLRSWGEGTFTERTHGVTTAQDGSVFCVDDAGHDVRKYTSSGALLLRLGTGRPSETGYDGRSLSSIRGGPPFNRPTQVAVADSGELFVTDGYGNARVHVFSPDGDLVRSWGAPGTGDGEFMLPHGIAVLSDGRVLVADRENDRVQLFDERGKFFGAWQVQRPTQVVEGPDGRIYVSSLWWRKGQQSPRFGTITEDSYGTVSVLTRDGGLVEIIGGGPPGSSGAFTAPHGLAVDSRGDVYVAEVTWTFGVKTGLVPDGLPTLQKLERTR